MTAPSRSLLRHPDFLKLWTAETISVFGSAITQLALPLIAATVLNVSAVRVRAAHDDRVPAVHPVQPAGRRLGGPPPPPPDPHRRRPRPGGGDRVDPGRVLLRRPDDLAAVHRRLHQRLPDRVLRRRLPELPAERRRTRPARRGQLEARDHAQRVPDPGARPGGDPDRLLPGAVRDDPRLGQLLRLGPVPDLDPASGTAGRGARRGGPRPEAVDAPGDRGRPAVRHRAPVAAEHRRDHRHLELLRQRDERDPDPVPRRRARARAGGDRVRVLGRVRRVPRRAP